MARFFDSIKNGGRGDALAEIEIKESFIVSGLSLDLFSSLESAEKFDVFVGSGAGFW